MCTRYVIILLKSIMLYKFLLNMIYHIVILVVFNLACLVAINSLIHLQKFMTPNLIALMIKWKMAKNLFF